MLQGVWIFLAFVVFNPRAREALRMESKNGEDNAAEMPMLDDVDKKWSECRLTEENTQMNPNLY